MCLDEPPLLAVLAGGQIYSGEMLARKFQLSRQSISKQVHALRALGLEIQAIKGQGYRLVSPFRRLDGDKITASLTQQGLRLQPRFALTFATRSTNDEAFALLDQHEGRVMVLAQYQSAGRGRRGRMWFAPLGANLYFSLGFVWQYGAATLEGLSLCVALALQRYLDEKGFSGVRVKWPNDLLHAGKKLAGILLEVRGECTDRLQVVVGIGLNVAMTQGQLQNIQRPVTTLEQIAPLPMDFNAFVAHLLGALEKELKRFEGAGFAAIQPSWKSVDALYGKAVSVVVNGQKLCGFGAGVDARGGYKIRHAKGVHVCRGGEISLYHHGLRDDFEY